MTLSIRRKTFLGILATMVLLTVVFYFGLSLFNEKHLETAERRFALETLLRAENLLEEKEADLQHVAHSISVLDPLWHAASGDAEHPLPAEFFATLPVDFILLVDNQQQVVFFHGFRALSDVAPSLPPLLQPYYAASLPTGTARSGLVAFDRQPLMLVMHPLIHLEDENEQAGMLVVGMLLGDAFWNHVNQDWQMRARLTLASDAVSATVTREASFQRLVPDIDGRDAFVLSADNIGFMRDYSRHNRLAFLGLFAFSCVIMVLISQRILDVLVLSRLVRLEEGVKQIGYTQTSDGPLFIAVDGADEIAAISHNINQMLERLRLGEQIRFQQEERFSDMIEHSGLVVIGIDHTSKIILFNQAAEQATGYPRRVALEHNFFDLLTTESTAEQLGGYIAQAMASGEFTSDFNAPLRISDGSLREFMWDAIFEYDAHGQIDNFIGFGRDITESLATQRRLSLINKVFENTAEAIMITDRNNQIIEVNQAFIATSGYSRSEVLGQNPRLLQSCHHDELFFDAMWKQLLKAGHWEGEVWNRRKNGDDYVSWVTIDTIRNQQGEISNFFSISSDISQIKEAEQQLHRLAYFDTLTGLPNRLSFSQQLQQLLEHCDEACNLAIMILDIDSFKLINESLGPVMADSLLEMFAERLILCSDDGTFLARIGGDEFAFILRKQQVSEVIAAIFECIDTPFTVGAQRITVTTSIGVAVAPDDGETVSELQKNASIALYSVANVRSNSFQYYDQSMSDQVSERIMLAEMLREALDHDEFELYYQPKVSLKNGHIVGAEALLRWHSRDGMIPPDRFIPIAEQTGLIRPIGEWVLKQACRQSETWRRIHPDFHIGVNLSPAQFDLDYLPQLVADVLQQTNLPAQALELEITEGMIIKDIDETVEILESLRQLGVELSIDDFGTGYSSLSYLTRLPLDILKIDRSFMFGVPDSRESTNVVLSILALARSLNLKVTAEGVETQDHVTLLHDNRCTYIQGYFCSKPLPAAEFEAFLKQRQCRCANCEGITWNP